MHLYINFLLDRLYGPHNTNSYLMFTGTVITFCKL